ncbi:MAG: hypothetical protein EPN45_22255 [Rhizobiaceae bacterium]|nr:MAG: hypothetical protein EPN45_22255 [Rhizobiaceae bacterium]
MADFVAVLKKTINGLGEATPETRKKVYDKARATIAAKLAQIDPPPSPTAVERQKKALEDAIGVIEAEYAPKPAEPEPADELDEFFASLTEAPAKAFVKPPLVAPGKPEPAAVAKAPIPSALAVEKQAPAREPPPSGLAGPASVPFSADEDEFDFHRPEMTTVIAPKIEVPRRRSRAGGLIAALIVLLVIAGAAYGAWMKRDQLAAKLGVDLPKFAKTEKAEPKAAPPAAKVAAGKPAPAAPVTKPTPAPSAPTEQKAAANPAPQAAAPAAKPAEPAAAPAEPTAQPTVQKFTERLLPNGSETNPGPSAGEAKIGEGSSVAVATTAPAPAQASNAAPAAPAGQQAGNAEATPNNTAQIPVGQHAIFYEERTDAAQGSAQNGTVVWSLVKESPGGDSPPEPAIRAEASIPGKDVQLRMTIRRNTDQTLPASHIIELIFLTPDHFEGGGIDSVLRIAMKDTEQSPGSPLLGIPARISDGFFLFALNNDKASIETNMNLLRQQNWIDIPLVYKSGRRALITLEKGIPGNKVFDEALKAWAQMAPSSSG